MTFMTWPTATWFPRDSRPHAKATDTLMRRRPAKPGAQAGTRARELSVIEGKASSGGATAQRGFDREPNPEARPLTGATSHFDRAVVIAHDAIGDHQAEPRPLIRIFGGEEGIENSFEILFIDPASRIFDQETHHLMLPFEIGRHTYGHFSSGGRRRDGVVHEVQQDLLQL